jgi:hypothetical protein
LRRGAELARAHFKQAEELYPTLATDVPYVRLEPAKGARLSDEEIKSLGLIPVYRREDAVLAAYSPDGDLRKLDSKLQSYIQQRKKLAALSKIERIGPWSREDRVSDRLRAEKIRPDREYTVDLLLFPMEDEASNPQAPARVEAFVQRQEGQIVDRAYDRNFSALRVRLGGQALDALLDYRDDVALVDLPPAAHILVPSVLSLDLEQVPPLTSPALTDPAICIVDSGILEGHPFLEPAMMLEKSRSFPEGLGPPVPRPPVDGARHGTNVAGIALYGDVGQCAVLKSFAPCIWLINARLLDDNNELHPDRMPFLRDVVEHVRDRCRILNLSFGLEACGDGLSVYAAEVDALTREFGMLFVVSSGNKATIAGEPPAKSYPDFLQDRDWRVLEPAEALNAITVGGITSGSDPYPPGMHRRAVAPKGAPSPFTRSGSLKNVVKPELVEVAGNLALDSALGRWVDNDSGLRVPTTGHEFASGRLLSLVTGTSFAAPKVAYMAAKILEKFPDASVNLLRALLVQSARYPEGVQEWTDGQLRLRLCGFGVPDLDRALCCRPHRATLYYQGEIVVDEVKLFDIPVPAEFAAAQGRKRIVVTAAYDPPVSVVHRDRPAGVHLAWQLARGDVSEGQVQSAIAAEAEREVAGTSGGERARSKRTFMKGTLPRRLQQRGTVQKDVFVWKRGVYGDTYRLAVTAKATRPAHQNERQRFAVVVTLEAEDDSINVYNLVRTRVDAARVRVRVKAE